MRKKSRNLSLSIGKTSSGFSLVELLVVIALFVGLAVIATQIIAITITGSKKTESQTKVRENVDYAFAVMERQIRSATSTSCPSDSQLDYNDESDISRSFVCQGGTNGYLSLDGERITSDTVNVDCTQPVFVCTDASGTVPPSVDIFVSASSSEIQDEEGASVTTATKIILRSY